MTIEAIEKNAVIQSTADLQNKLGALHEAFSGFVGESKALSVADNALETSVFSKFGIGNIESPAILKTAKGIWNGTDAFGNKCLGLDEITDHKVNGDYRYSNLKQQAGWAAEVIGTAKENAEAIKNGTGVQTYRVDNLPEDIKKQVEKSGYTFADKNDPYVDKIRLKDGKVETVQTKFVGKTPKECLSKLTSKKYEKYIESGKVDKLEIPKDYYDEVKTQIAEKKDSLLSQVDRVSAEGKSATAEKLQSDVNKLEKLNEMLEPSTVSSKEAMLSVQAGRAHKAGLSSAKGASMLTAAVSGAENIKKYADGEISGVEALKDTAEDTAIAGGIGYVTGAVTELAGGSSIPGAVIAMGVESYDDVKDYFEGEVSGEELAYNLGENASRVIGGAVGGALGTAAGTAVGGPVGSVVGGVAGATAGSAAAVKAYQETVEFISENADEIIEKGSEIAGNIGDAAVKVAGDVKDVVSDAVDSAAEVLDNIGDKASETLDDLGDKASELKDAAKAKIANFPFWD